MSKRKLFAAAATAVAGALALSACTPTTPGTTGSGTGGDAATPTAINVAWNQAFFSRNSDTDYGNATANNNILYMANDAIGYYNQDLEITQNPSFGSYELVSEDPLQVEINFAETATWSDGTPVTAADAVLLWGATSTNFNTVSEAEQESIEVDDDTGEVSGVAGDAVYFNAASPGYQLITDFPEISDDGKSLTYTFSQPFVDWEILAMSPTTVPAHVVGMRALGAADAEAGKQAVLDAFQNNDRAALAEIAKVFNNDFNFKSMPTEEDLLVSSGPYVITDLVEEQYITLERNENYQGERTPSIDQVTVRIIPDAQASVQALQNGEVLITQPQSTADILQQLQAMDNVEVLTQSGATYEHVDLVFNNGGPFDPATYGGNADTARLVRQAFLQAIPRQQIIDNIIKPLNPEAEVRNSFSVVPGSPEYDATAEANGMEATYGGGGNVDAARELLAQAGVTNPTVRMMFAQNNTRRQQQFQLISEAAGQAGFTVVDVSSVDWGQLLSQNDQYDASLFGWQSTAVGVSQVPPNFLSDGQNNYGGFNSTRADELLNELNVTTDPDRQNEIVREVEKILVDEAFGITIFQFPEITGISNQVTGVSSIPLAPTYFWNFWEWEVA
ncbi:ABC transporter family substrate-binding protein [Propioniciclava soli]|uniref:ABC transporter family substrate-binding protein n=1 Tax=Propioniciclava soli TaxID=2775081 RepID=A0ABZ3C4N7_9ACTN